MGPSTGSKWDCHTNTSLPVERAASHCNVIKWIWFTYPLPRSQLMWVPHWAKAQPLWAAEAISEPASPQGLENSSRWLLPPEASCLPGSPEKMRVHQAIAFRLEPLSQRKVMADWWERRNGLLCLPLCLLQAPWTQIQAVPSQDPQDTNDMGNK